MTENGADYMGAVSPPAKATNGPPWLLQGNPGIAKKHPQNGSVARTSWLQYVTDTP